MKLVERFEQWLSEFNDDGGKYQLARPADGTWTSLWKSHLRIGGIKTVLMEGGYTSTTSDSHTLVINVTVVPIQLQNAAEDQANETITVYYRDFKTEKEAREEMARIMANGIEEYGSGRSNDLSVQLSTQRGAGTITP